MKRFYTWMSVALLVVTSHSVAQAQEEGKQLRLHDTIYVNDSYQTVKQENATMMGVVHQVNDETNVASIRFFSLKDNHITAVEKRVASGEDFGKKKGKQLYFDEDNQVKSMDFYTLIRNESVHKNYSWLASTTRLYPDGKVKQEIKFTIPDSLGGRNRYYERKYYYPTGVLQYHEIVNKTTISVVYYDEEGNETTQPVKTFPIYETLPTYPRGQVGLSEFFRANCKYPESAKENGIQGTVICKFGVNSNGSITNVDVIQSSGDKSLDKEAKRLVKMMLPWKSGSRNGKLARVYYDLPITFQLQEPVVCVSYYEENHPLIKEATKIAAETMPEFPGGVKELSRFLSNNVKYPPEAAAKNLGGKVVCQFVVEKDGSISEVEVVKSSGHALLDDEAVRVVSIMPKWKPGTQDGQPVRVQYSIPVNFNPGKENGKSSTNTGQKEH